MTNYVNGVSQHLYQPAGGGLDAEQELTGPGSTAYVGYGPYSSYAHESYQGGIYERNITNTLGYSPYSYYSVQTNYKHYDAGYSYSKFSRSVYSDNPGYVPHAYDQPSSIYTQSSEKAVTSGGINDIHQYTATQYNYSNGSYLRSTSYITFEERGGEYIPGSSSSNFSTIYGPPSGYYGYAGYYGYYSNMS